MKIVITTTTYKEVDLHTLPFTDWPAEAVRLAYQMPASSIRQLAEMELEARKAYVIDFVERRARFATMTLNDLF